MSFGRTKVILSFALLGFIVGAAAYFAFEWIVTPTAMSGISLPSFLQVLSAPWFISGIAGSLLSIAILFVYAQTHSADS